MNPSDIIASETEPARSWPPAGAEPKKGPRGDSWGAGQVHRHDFRQSALVPVREMRKLRQRQIEFARNLSDRLTLYLRLDCTFQFTDLFTTTYEKFCGTLTTPTHVSLFKLSPLRGVSLLEIPPRLGLTFVDRLLGGPGELSNAERDLSEIEVALLDQAVQIMLEEWTRQWNGLQPLHPELLGHETNGRFLQTAPSDTTMLVAHFDASLGETEAPVQLAFPYFTLQPLVRQLNPPLETTNPDPVPVATAPLQWNPDWNEIKVSIFAGWSGLELTARELADLKIGDLVQLAPHCAAQVQVRIADKPKFLARLGTCARSWAVELIEPLSEQTKP